MAAQRPPEKTKRFRRTSAARPTIRIALVVLAALLGAALGLGALLGAATVTDRPQLFVLAGLLTFCAIYSLGLMFVTRKVGAEDRKSTRLNSSHANISYAVFCLKK